MKKPDWTRTRTIRTQPDAKEHPSLAPKFCVLRKASLLFVCMHTKDIGWLTDRCTNKAKPWLNQSLTNVWGKYTDPWDSDTDLSIRWSNATRFRTVSLVLAMFNEKCIWPARLPFYTFGVPFVKSGELRYNPPRQCFLPWCLDSDPSCRRGRVDRREERRNGHTPRTHPSTVLGTFSTQVTCAVSRRDVRLWYANRYLKLFIDDRRKKWKRKQLDRPADGVYWSSISSASVAKGFFPNLSGREVYRSCSWLLTGARQRLAVDVFPQGDSEA